jgi:cytochrome c oxidase cbb3-type subunit 4
VEFIAIFQSVWTIIVMLAFLGIIIWAYSRKRQTSFDEAARSPIDDDDSVEETIKEQHYV